MISIENFTAGIADHIRKAQNGGVYYEEIFSDPDLPVRKNEFLFFIKPEITLASETIKLERILDLIYTRISSFGFVIHTSKILAAPYLDKYNIIARHYGVINQIASNALAHMSASAKSKFGELYGLAVDEAHVLGGIEFLEKFPAYSAADLADLWRNSDFQKLAGGTYCVRFVHEGEVVFLINGFHPMQLKHFIEDNRSIVVMTLSGDTSWRVARNDFVGATMPANANRGSLRREFLDKQAELGLAGISPSMNGVHLSAGPVEALVELRRYNSDFSDPSKILKWQDFSFGRKLLAYFSEEAVEKITSNAVLRGEEVTVSVFDLTEETDSDEAIQRLSAYF
jgi:hypothetical protein